MKPLILSLALALGLSGCDSSSNNNSQADVTTLTVNLTGTQEVPPVDTANTATGTVTVTSENGSNVLTAELITNGFTATMVHIHEGFAGANGDVAIGLTQDESNSNRWTATADIDIDELSAFEAAGFYFNAHSSENTGGEVRGQIVPDGISVKHFILEGSQEVPPVETSATGFGAVTVDETSGEIILHAVSDVANANAAHIHQGATGANGGVIQALTRDSGDTNRWSTPANTSLSQNVAEGETESPLDAYGSGNLYVNIHSDAHPSGELRGQIPASE